MDPSVGGGGSGGQLGDPRAADAMDGGGPPIDLDRREGRHGDGGAVLETQAEVLDP